MEKIKIIIERASDGTYGAYAEGDYPITGMGDSVEACKQSVLDSIETNIEIGYLEGLAHQEYELIYRFDTESLLQYYKGIFSNPAFERLTGINQKLMHQYATGLKKPREAQRKRIEKALHQLGKELLAIEL
ncbi:hypothetical protein [Tannerella sp.]|uniref:hypothetical protein n=1 Tax=Tannerella sp. TaxID=2382127 RepID=UPI0026DCCDA1|nr:hypothetical protein [Tannerella sp.]MDO4704431.1 hypothetical protein [Tannerella sp.]